ncbi:MAG: F0F1 ATP synthase subunit epsilon [Cyanobacteria bacterium J06641_5]
MHLKILLPTEIFLDRPVAKITAEAENGSFCLLPQHIDFVAALVPGILSFETAESGEEVFLAIDAGILLKCGEEVFVSVRAAAGGTNLAALQKTVEAEYRTLDERQKQARSALAKLEAAFVRQLLVGGEPR